MGQFSLNGTFTYLPDPSAFIFEGRPMRGTDVEGTGILATNYVGTLIWDCLTQQQYGELHTRWNTNKGKSVGGKLIEWNTDPSSSYTTTTKGFFHEPLGEARGGLRFNVRMRVEFYN